MTRWAIDPTHSELGFRVKHMMIATVRGRFRDVVGTIEIDEDDLSRSTVEARVSVASIDTGVDQRDDHLRSADFFDAATYPEIAFKSTKIERAGGGYRVHGDLTIRDTTRSVVLETQPLGVVAGLDGVRRAAFSARTQINRGDWGLTWNVALEAGGWLVGDEIAIELDIAAVEVVEVGRHREASRPAA
jgi:polyisoprenoid-binding protein YceI